MPSYAQGEEVIVGVLLNRYSCVCKLSHSKYDSNLIV